MLQTAHNYIPPKKFSPHKKQGWNDKLRQAQWAAKQAYKAWKAAGKPRSSDHSVRNYYKSSKGKFRFLLRQHKREERENFFASLDLHNTDSQKLFHTIRQKNGHQTVPTTQLVSRGKTYEGSEVMDSWKTHFQDLPSPTPSSSFDDTFQSTITEEFQHLLTIPPDEDITVSPGEVAKAIESLASKKHLAQMSLRLSTCISEDPPSLYIWPTFVMPYLPLDTSLYPSCMAT